MTGMVERIRAAIVRDLERVEPLSGSEMSYDPETGIVDFNGCFRPEEIARAVLEALKEPTPEMVEAGWLTISCDHPAQSDMSRGAETDAWQAMIDAALSPQV